MHLGGRSGSETVSGRGSAPRRIPFVAPAWASGVVVDVTMDRAQWGRFTDFGVTLFDSLGRQIEKQPLNYAFGRLQVELPEGHGDMPVELGLFPGFADPADTQPWTLRASHPAVRRHARSRSRRPPPASTDVTVAPAAPSAAGFTLAAESAGRWATGSFPLGLLVARADGRQLDPRGRPARRRRPALADEPRVVRVAAGQGFWGDWLEAPVRQVRGRARSTI